jgi:hypothetical protein
MSNYPNIHPDRIAPPDQQEVFNTALQGLVDNKLSQYPDSIIDVPAVFGEETKQSLYWRTHDQGTIFVYRTIRNDGKNTPRAWTIEKYGPDVEGFFPDREAYCTLYTNSDRTVGGFSVPGTYDELYDDNVSGVIELVTAATQSTEPMSRAEAEALHELRQTTGKQYGQEARPHIGGSSSELRAFKRNYAKRREAAMSGNAQVVVPIEPFGPALVTKIPLAETLDDTGPVEVSASDTVNAHIADLLHEKRERAQAAYLVSWRGSKVARGSIIDGQVIHTMQHGLVFSVTGEQMGTYSSILESAGDNHDNQEVVIFLSKRSEQ